MRNELTQIREQISNLPHFQTGELEAKIHAVEHPLYVETIRRLLEERPAAAKSEK